LSIIQRRQRKARSAKCATSAPPGLQARVGRTRSAFDRGLPNKHTAGACEDRTLGDMLIFSAPRQHVPVRTGWARLH
jgi:hypothetical protein